MADTYTYPDGYASIYCQTWWGDDANKFAIPFDPCEDQPPPFTEDLQLDYDKLVDGEFVERISGDVAPVVGGYVGSFDGTPMQRITFNYKADGNPSVEAYAHITKADGLNNWIIENSNGTNAGRLLQLTRNSSNLISFVIYNSAGTAQALTSVNTYLQGSKICVNAWYDGSDLRLQIRDLSGNLLEDLTNNIGAITLRNTLNDRLDVGGNSWFADPSLQGSIWSVKYTSGSTLVLDTSLNNHAINSVDNVAGTIFLGATFALNNSDVLASTLSALENGYFKLSTGEKVINPQFALPAGAKALAGSVDIHNGIDSFSRFYVGTTVPDARFNILDRSNATYQTTASRDSVYYDSAQTGLYFMSLEFNELDHDVLNANATPYMQPTAINRAFLGLETNYGTVLNSFRFFTYATQKSGTDLTDVLLYINYLAPYAITDGSGYFCTDGFYYVKYN